MRVELRDACFAFAPDRPVFRNLNFNVGEGEILAVLGPNGTGKTTFLKTILGIFKLNQGVIFFNGTKIRGSLKYCINFSCYYHEHSSTGFHHSLK